VTLPKRLFQLGLVQKKISSLETPNEKKSPTTTGK
jgi:hypothetical protein